MKLYILASPTTPKTVVDALNNGCYDTVVNALAKPGVIPNLRELIKGSPAAFAVETVQIGQNPQPIVHLTLTGVDMDVDEGGDSENARDADQIRDELFDVAMGFANISSTAGIGVGVEIMPTDDAGIDRYGVSTGSGA